jgi:cell division septation protein DedD
MKKLLLVAVSVGVFLSVTIIIAIIVLTPATQTPEAAFYSSVPFSQGRVQSPAEAIINGAQEPEINVIEIPEPVAIADRDNGDSLTIQIPAPITTAVPSIPRDQAPSVQIAPPPAARPATTTTAPAPAAAPAAAPRPAAPRIINDYWIQIGAYSAIIRAEDVRERLASNGFISIIENHIINGQSLYRVRLGPYTTEREANHWLAIVRTIDGFHDSQVRQTVRQQ